MHEPWVLSAVNISLGNASKWYTDLLTELNKKPLTLLSESDARYGRTVLSVVGPLSRVFDALETLVQTAVKKIDLGTHHGTHFRMGAVDVIPFVLLKGDEEALMKRVHAFGQKISEYHPVIMYQKSALNPAHVSLKAIRKGGFERRIEEIKKGQVPYDYGHRASCLKVGCSAVGVRDHLLAYNVTVKTDKKLLLKTIARSIRESSGGHLGIDAAVFMSGPLDYDISMNLRMFSVYKVETIYDEISQRLKAAGLTVESSEIVGYISRFMSDYTGTNEGYTHYLKERLRLKNFHSGKVLENVIVE